MPDSSWQQAVLRDLGVSQRGLKVLDAAASVAAPPAWGAEAPPRPAPEPQPAVAPVVMPEPVQAVPQPPPAPMQAAVEPPPPPPPPMQATAESQPPPMQATAEPPPPPPPPPLLSPQAEPSQEGAEPPPQPPFAAPAHEELEPPPPPPPPLPGFESGPQQPVDAPPEQPQEQPEPEQPAQPPVAQPTHFDFDWAAAVNPLIGVDTTDVPVHSAAASPAAPADPQVQPQQPAQPQPHGTAEASGPVPAEELVRKNQHGDPLARRMGRSVRKAVGGGSREAREMGAFLELMRTPVPGSRQIAVASVRGGAGKTTMAALVATELARYRQDRVLAADADAELGSLPLRLGVRTQLSLFDLAGQNPRTFEEAARFLSRTPEGLFVLSSTRGGRIAGEFTLEMFQSALNVVARYVGATVIDCGAGILTELNRGVVASSHGLVLVTPGTVDGALSARGALEWYAGNDQQDLLRRTVIAMVSHAPQVGADLHRAHQMLTAWGLPVVFVPYDRHLATGSSVDMSKVSAAARASVTRVVHEVFARALSAGTGR